MSTPPPPHSDSLPRNDFGAPPVPPEPALGPAAAHLAAAEDAARRADFGTALRERYRAVTRGLEQRGILQEQRARTARETAQAATAVLPEATELPSAAHSFDEIVYGGRPGAEAEYRRLEQADQFSVAPPPKHAPVEITEERRTKKKRAPRAKKEREPLKLPALLRNWRFWAGMGALLAIVLLVYLVTNIGAPPPAPHHDNTHYTSTTTTTRPPPTTRHAPNFGEGDDSIFETMPAWAAFGGAQLLIAWGTVLWWRGRRRGSVVREPLPVEAPANEVLAGQAGLYRKSRDHDHVAAKLRAATLRRLRPALGVTAETAPELVIAGLATRLRADPATLRAALYDPVPDRGALELVAAQLEWIEAEVL
ncbi:DUF4129 domain-containing protein [Nocardia sp. SYP-A9097]|uniref:DUF4129 domain-containing protein n=1 Tax=Nocardia sp. SYP-A9097 TaxID=2663237 RepID=UPI00129B34DF|nr:DUF4129 domain-containing protein [Nocardia sp. SYP-A9097]MRH86268.1 DUF4129 domain-containing protein [Nocardia sp. SYP-A9097]